MPSSYFTAVILCPVGVDCVDQVLEPGDVTVIVDSVAGPVVESGSGTTYADEGDTAFRSLSVEGLRLLAYGGILLHRYAHRRQLYPVLELHFADLDGFEECLQYPAGHVSVSFPTLCARWRDGPLRVPVKR